MDEEGEGYVEYKGYRIRAVSVYLPDVGKWQPRVEVLRKGSRSIPLEAQEALSSSEQTANWYAVEMARIWIDNMTK